MNDLNQTCAPRISFGGKSVERKTETTPKHPRDTGDGQSLDSTIHELAVKAIAAYCQGAGIAIAEIRLHEVPAEASTSKQIFAWFQSIPGISTKILRPTDIGFGGPFHLQVKRADTGIQGVADAQQLLKQFRISQQVRMQMADRFIKGKLVAFRGFTTKKKFLGKLSETFSKEALAALSLQKTTMAYVLGEIVKGFYFSLNIDAVPPAEKQSLCATLVRSELGHAIRWRLLYEPQLSPEPLKVQNIVKVYEGQAGQCRCGCSGEYYYNPALDNEINARNAEPDQFLSCPERRNNRLTDVTRIVELINSHLTDEYDTVLGIAKPDTMTNAIRLAAPGTN
jgi:hypothetical protein